MKIMRRLLVAGLAALAVVLGLVVTTGVAAAAAPSLHDPHGGNGNGGISNGTGGTSVRSGNTITCTGTVGTACNTILQNGHTDSCTPTGTAGAAGSCVDTLGGELGRNVGGLLGGVRDGLGGNDHACPLSNRCDPGGPIRGGGLGGSWHPGLPWGGPALYGHQLWVQASLGLDICGFGDSYDTFVNRNLRYRSDIDRLLDRGRWQSLYSSDCNSGLAVLPGGLNLVNGDLLNLDLLGLNGAGTVNVCSYPDWNTFDSRLGGRYGSRWGSVRGHFGGNAFNEFRQLRVNAHCTTVVMPSSTTIVQNAAPTTVEAAPADPSTGDEAASNPPAAAPLAAGPVPSGAVQTGGDSPAWVLAHARAV